MIRFQRPRCQASLQVPPRIAGKKGACPKCGQCLQVPTPPRQTVLGVLSEPPPVYSPHEPAEPDVPRPVSSGRLAGCAWVVAMALLGGATPAASLLLARRTERRRQATDSRRSDDEGTRVRSARGQRRRRSRYGPFSYFGHLVCAFRSAFVGSDLGHPRRGGAGSGRGHFVGCGHLLPLARIARLSRIASFGVIADLRMVSEPQVAVGSRVPPLWAVTQSNYRPDPRSTSRKGETLVHFIGLVDENRVRKKRIRPDLRRIITLRSVGRSNRSS